MTNPEADPLLDGVADGVPDRSIEAASIELPVRGEAYRRPAVETIAGLKSVGSATACATLNKMGITRTFINGPRSIRPGDVMQGTARTLQFMPQREDIGSGRTQEDAEKRTALWAVLEAVEPGDVLVIQAYGSEYSGCLGEMLVRYFQQRGGAGIVVDGRIRDFSRVSQLGVPIWCTGTTPHYASQSELFPWAYDVPVAVGGVLCLPGDVVLADDDGAVVVPRQLGAQLAADATAHEGWESFSRFKIDAGERLSDYYPLNDLTRSEYEAWDGRTEH